MRRAYKSQTPQHEDIFVPLVPEPRQPGWTKQELLDAVPGGREHAISPKTFDTIRKAARVNGPSHGGRNHLFSPEDLFALIDKAESGRFTERGVAPAAAWRGLLAEAGVPVPENVGRSRSTRGPRRSSR